MENVEIQAVIDSLGLTVESVFIPFSQSRNKAEEYPSLNWSVTLCKNGKPIITTDYSAGCAHCPSYKQGKLTISQANAIKKECETGNRYYIRNTGDAERMFPLKPILPDTLNVIYSLQADADVLNYSNFVEWADCMGYSTDSRQAEKTYRACLEIALALRAAIGDNGMQALNEAFQDY